MPIPLETAQSQLDLYVKAEAAVLTGQSYEIHGRKVTRANLADIQKGIETWTGRVDAASAPRQRRSRVTIIPASTV